jgi:hypothetical protein
MYNTKKEVEIRALKKWQMKPLQLNISKVPKN